MKISGVLFVLERSEPGRYELFILNRLGLKNFELDLKSTVTFYQFGDILIFNTYDGASLVLSDDTDILN